MLNRLGGWGIAALTAGRAAIRAPFQVEYPELAMPLHGLGPGLQGLRIVHLSDLHTDCGTPMDFLCSVVDRINRDPADLVCVTGDLLTSRRKELAAACELLMRLQKPTYVVFGNHDYADGSQPWCSSELADELEDLLGACGITILRNRAVPIERQGSRLWLVGLEDFWSTRFCPEQAFAEVDPSEPVIALSHNPDTIFALEHFGAQWVLAGHTHGGQIRIPVFGPLILPLRNRELDQGLFRVGRSWLYVTRGIGFRVRARFRCPPEVPCFVLRSADR